jgi:hypothetical protein
MRRRSRDEHAVGPGQQQRAAQRGRVAHDLAHQALRVDVVLDLRGRTRHGTTQEPLVTPARGLGLCPKLVLLGAGRKQPGSRPLGAAAQPRSCPRPAPSDARSPWEHVLGTQTPGPLGARVGHPNPGRAGLGLTRRSRLSTSSTCSRLSSVSASMSCGKGAEYERRAARAEGSGRQAQHTPARRSPHRRLTRVSPSHRSLTALSQRWATSPATAPHFLTQTPAPTAPYLRAQPVVQQQHT